MVLFVVVVFLHNDGEVSLVDVVDDDDDAGDAKAPAFSEEEEQGGVMLGSLSCL